MITTETRANGGARPGAGRKTDHFKKMFDDAARRIITQVEMDSLLSATLSAAKEGDMKAASLIFDRLLGKVPQPVTGEDGGAMLVRVLYERVSPHAADTAPGTEGDSEGEEAF